MLKIDVQKRTIDTHLNQKWFTAVDRYTIANADEWNQSPESLIDIFYDCFLNVGKWHYGGDYSIDTNGCNWQGIDQWILKYGCCCRWENEWEWWTLAAARHVFPSAASIGQRQEIYGRVRRSPLLSLSSLITRLSYAETYWAHVHPILWHLEKENKRKKKNTRFRRVEPSTSVTVRTIRNPSKNLQWSSKVFWWIANPFRNRSALWQC